jgi:CubicO group peptidase (beta-lactamase class C family)
MSDIRHQVQQVIDELVASDAERGIQVAVYRHGDRVVDAVAGVADPATGRPVTTGTVFYNYSIGKGATATIAHILAERGVFDYDTRVADLWPEFAAHGKNKVTLRHVLTHAAGVPGLPRDTTPEDVCDWDKICATIADAELWWEPGTQIGYHAYTFGFLIGELVRRATGRTISQVLREDLAGPLGVADEFYFGMPAAEHGRLAILEDAPGTDEMLASMPDDLPMFDAGPKALFPTAALGNREDYLTADIPAGAKVSARAIARMYAALLGNVTGVPLISADRLRTISAPAASGTDRVFGNEATWGLGYAIGAPGPAACFGMAGAGGSYAYADPTTGIALAVTKNRLTGDFTSVERILDLVNRWNVSS